MNSAKQRGMTPKVMLSAVQPSNRLTIGNYLGALKNWVRLQSEYDCIFFAVDLHTITTPQDPEVLREQTYRVIAMYLACGIDPSQATLFAQSGVPAHAELAWILSCFTRFGELQRMTQFRTKVSERHSVPCGLFTYPVLMAADILLYQTNLVPVGEDQKQHVELARDIAGRVNKTYSDMIFTIPEPYIPPVAARVMSLRDPTSKMSKSDPDPNSAIYLDDTNDQIYRKFRSAVTDSGSDVSYERTKPGVSNLLEIQAALLDETPRGIAERYAGCGYGRLKSETADLVISTLEPIRDETQRLLASRETLAEIMRAGADLARVRAAQTLDRLFDAIGLIPRRS